MGQCNPHKHAYPCWLMINKDRTSVLTFKFPEIRQSGWSRYIEKDAFQISFEIPWQSKFQHNNKIYIKGNKRRTRYECVEVITDKKYLFHANAEVDLLK